MTELQVCMEFMLEISNPFRYKSSNKGKRESDKQIIMNSMKTCPSVTFYFMNNSFSDVSRKWILPNMIRAVPIPTYLVGPLPANIGK